MELRSLDTEQIGIKTLEKRLVKSDSNVSLKIGLPKEQSNDERRLSLTPGGTSVLKANGHEIMIEQSAGSEAKFADRDYADAGAEICYSPEELYKKSEIILKVAPPTEKECDLLQPKQVLISALHLGNASDVFVDQLLEKSVTGIGYEFIKAEDNDFPIVRMMHEITGSLSVQIAAHYLESSSNGQGIMLGGISGVPPATVVILGADITAEYAARTALGYGAQVFVMDTGKEIR